MSRVRLQLAQLLALGLQILLCSDILETLVRSTSEYTYDALFKLALIATIRTALSFFLGLETQEIADRAKLDQAIDGYECPLGLAGGESSISQDDDEAELARSAVALRAMRKAEAATRTATAVVERRLDVDDQGLDDVIVRPVVVDKESRPRPATASQQPPPQEGFE